MKAEEPRPRERKEPFHGAIQQVVDRSHGLVTSLFGAVTLPRPASGPAANGVSSDSRAGARRGRAGPSRAAANGGAFGLRAGARRYRADPFPPAARTARAAEPEVDPGTAAATRWRGREASASAAGT